MQWIWVPNRWSGSSWKNQLKRQEKGASLKLRRCQSIHLFILSNSLDRSEQRARPTDEGLFTQKNSSYIRTKIPKNSKKKIRKIQGFFWGFKIRTPYLGVRKKIPKKVKKPEKSRKKLNKSEKTEKSKKPEKIWKIRKNSKTRKKLNNSEKIRKNKKKTEKI